MNGIRHAMPHSGHRGKGIGAYAQMRLLAQVLKGMPLGRHGVGLGIVHHTHRLNARGQQFDTLALALGGNHLALGNERTAGG